MVQPYNKVKNLIVAVWDCFGGDGQKSDLVYMPGDFDSKKGGVTTAVYIAASDPDDHAERIKTLGHVVVK